MLENLVTEVVFVLPLNFRHRQQAIDKLGASGTACVTSSRFVLNNVPAFEFARAVHRYQPTAEMTKKTQRSPDNRRAQLAPPIGLRAELHKHFTDELSMMPFLVFNLSNSLFLFEVGHRLPVTSVSVSGGTFAGVGEAQDRYEAFAG